MKILSFYKKSSNLSRLFVLYIVLASTFITILTSAFQLYDIYKNDISGIQKRLNEIQDSYSSNIASRVWVANIKELEIALNGILRLPDIEYIEVFEGDELIIKKGSFPLSDSIVKDFSLFHNFNKKSEKIGRVHVVASLSSTYQHLIDQAITIIVSNGIKTFLVSGFIIFLFYWLVARHLVTLANFAKTLNLDALDNTLILNRNTHKEDELDHLANTLLRLQARLRKSVISLEESKITLANSEAKFRGAIESAVNGILIINQYGIITMANDALCDMTAYSEKELMGEKIEILVPDSFTNHEKLRNAYVNKPTRRSMGLGEVFSAKRKDGSQFPVEVSLTPIELEDGMMVSAMIQDVTVRHQIEEERIELLESLTQKNEELERFTYTVSHDLKSPLVTITGFIGLLKKDIKSGNEKRIESDFARISDAANTMQDLLHDLLELSRIGRQMSPNKDSDLNSIVNDAIELLHAKIKSNKAHIVVEPDLPIIYCDENRIKEVYQNLIENAIKYKSENEKPEITIGVKDEKKNNSNKTERVFFVKDNGIGIEPRYHSKVFGLFERMSTEKEGTGIGLAIVKRVVDVHKGRVWVESEGLGKGSIFKFVLPEKRKKSKK